MVLRFAGFELDPQRAELRGRDGHAIKLRPKSFALLVLLATNAGRVLSKQELMQAIWPTVRVGEANLFQCILEIRAALDDEARQIIKAVSGRGYLFDAKVTNAPATARPQAPLPGPVSPAEAGITAESATLWRPLAAVAGGSAVFGLVIVATMFGPDLVVGPRPPAIAVMQIATAGNDGDITAMATSVTDRLREGLARIDNVRAVAPPSGAAASPSSAHSAPADFVVTGELRKDEHAWTLQARMIKTASREVQPVASISVDIKDSDLDLQQSRLAAGIGHPLALRVNALLNSDARPAAVNAKVVIEQATASIMQTSRERFAVAQTMLEKALAADPDNVDLAVALAALQLRGVQMVWYSPAESAAAENNARSILERALRIKPSSIPVLEAYCRFLNTTNQFVESKKACAKALSFDPWNGLALYHIGLAQVQLGRFEDALATFKQADRFDTPQVSRWTWKLGAGMTYLLMGRSEDALPWLQRSIAITPASGRTYMLLSAAYQGLGQPAEAKAAMDKALALRPGSNLGNVALPPKNASTIFVAASEWIGRAYVAAGLPER